MNLFTKIFDAIKHLVSRPGFKTFIGKYEKLALETVSGLAAVNNNASFGLWKDAAFSKLKSATGGNDNWIAILIHLAYESFKAQQGEGDTRTTAPLPQV